MDRPSGFGALDLNNPAYREIRQENQRKAKDVDELFHRVFKQNPEGAKVLAHLDNYIIKAMVSADFTDQALRHYAGKRELVMEIHAAIKRIEEGVHGP